MLGISIVLLVVVGLLHSSGADTTLPNPLIGTLSAFNNPYVSEQNVQVPVGGSLIIQPGTVIKFAPGKGLDVHGSIKAQGTEKNKVIFKLWDEKKTVWNPPSTPTVRLVDKTAPDKGQYLINTLILHA